MDIVIELGTENDIDCLEKMYDDLNDYLEKGINYPGWKKGIYPTREEAEKGVSEGYLYVAKVKGQLAGSIVLNHQPEEAYSEVDWSFDTDYSDVIVIHTFAIHPNYMKRGIGKALMDYAINHAVMEKMRSIRLDVYENNTPAINLYLKSGFQYAGTVDLGLGAYGLDWFKLYEKIIK